MLIDEAMLPYRRPPGTRPQQTSSGHYVEGEAYDVGVKGMRFTVRDWDGGKHVFGPAPWPMSRVQPVTLAGPVTHDHLETNPVKGDRVLVLFLGSGVDQPWILGWWPA